MMQSGIFLLRYRTEITDAGMPMPALVLRMPMPSYGCHPGFHLELSSGVVIWIFIWVFITNKLEK
jgi:hypothetical protein